MSYLTFGWYVVVFVYLSVIVTFDLVFYIFGVFSMCGMYEWYAWGQMHECDVYQGECLYYSYSCIFELRWFQGL